MDGGGTVRAAIKLEDNLNPIGRVFYSASTFICTPASRVAGSRARVGCAGGRGPAEKGDPGRRISNVRRAAETPFNMVLEARP